MAERSLPTRSPQHRLRTARPDGPLRTEAGNTTAGNLVGLAGFVTLAVLGYHGREFDVQQTTYASREDCLNDWGTEESCQQAGAGQGRTVYYGPRYYWDPERGKPVVVGNDGSERVATSARIGPAGSRFGSTSFTGHFARGGFGGIGRGFGSGHA